jgi:hypothetical protein
LLDAIDGEIPGTKGQSQLLQRACQMADELGRTPDENKAIVMALVGRVEIRLDCVKIDISQSRLSALLASPSIELSTENREANRFNSRDRVFTLTAPMRLKRVGREMKMLIDDTNGNGAVDMGLLRVIARAHDIQERLAQDTALTVHEIAFAECNTAAYIYTLLRLPWLAPDITTAIVNGRQPPQLSAKKLMRLTAHLPADWTEQRALLGFD